MNELNKAIFLDRDGVILIETHYLHTLEKTQLIAGALDTIRQANSLGLPVVVDGPLVAARAPGPPAAVPHTVAQPVAGAAVLVPVQKKGSIS